MTTLRAVALGYQGFGNVGDEAILAGIERLLDGSGIEVVAVIGGNREPIPAYPGAARVLSRRLLPTPAAVRAMRRAKVLLLAGGGLIHDHWPVVIPRYLAWSLLARGLGLRVAWVGVGLGPIRRPWARTMAGMTARLASAVTVRDQGSLEWIRHLAPRARASLLPDPAFFLPPPGGSPRDGLGIIVRKPLPTQEHLEPALRAAIAGLARQRIADGQPVTLLSMERDLDYARAISATSRGANPSPPAARALPLEPAAALAELGGFTEVVSMRLHGLILCALADTPCLPIAYDPKVASTAALLGLGGHVTALHDVDAALLIDGLATVRDEAIRRMVRAAIDQIRSQSPHAVAPIRALVDG